MKKIFAWTAHRVADAMTITGTDEDGKKLKVTGTIIISAEAGLDHPVATDKFGRRFFLVSARAG